MLKFLDFYACGVGSRGGLFANVSSVECNATLADYFANPTLEECNAHANCILSTSDKITPQFMAQLSSGNVMLGLTPGLLSTLGPTVGEISLLSSKVPLLSFLLSMGATVIYPTRPFDYSEPTKILKKGTVMPSWWANTPKDYLLITLEYIIAAAACANVWQNSYQLGRQTTFAPICNESWWVVGWTAIPSIIHILAAVGYNTKIIRAGRGKDTQSRERAHLQRGSDEREHSTSHLTQNLPQDPKTSRPYMSGAQNANENSGVWMESLFDRTIAPPVADIPWWLKVVNSSCSFLSFVHIIFGVFIFSSLQFVCAGDAVGVLGRYVASAVVCRLIMIIEFARMRLKWRDHPGMMGEGIPLQQRGGGNIVPQHED